MSKRYQLSNSVLKEIGHFILKDLITDSEMSTLDDMLNAAKFVPAIQAVLLKFLSLPVTTATIERSFSTLRRVKTVALNNVRIQNQWSLHVKRL